MHWSMKRIINHCCDIDFSSGQSSPRTNNLRHTAFESGRKNPLFHNVTCMRGKYGQQMKIFPRHTDSAGEFNEPSAQWSAMQLGKNFDRLWQWPQTALWRGMLGKSIYLLGTVTSADSHVIEHRSSVNTGHMIAIRQLVDIQRKAYWLLIRSVDWDTSVPRTKSLECFLSFIILWR